MFPFLVSQYAWVHAPFQRQLRRVSAKQIWRKNTSDLFIRKAQRLEKKKTKKKQTSIWSHNIVCLALFTCSRKEMCWRKPVQVIKRASGGIPEMPGRWPHPTWQEKRGGEGGMQRHAMSRDESGEGLRRQVPKWSLHPTAWSMFSEICTECKFD